VDDRTHETISTSHRTVTVVGAVLLVTMALLLAFAVYWESWANGWPMLPLGLQWIDPVLLALAVAVPVGGMYVADLMVVRAARRGKGTKIGVAMQIVGWATLGLWASCQVPLLLGFALAHVRQRGLYLLPFYAVSVACALTVMPPLRTWDRWFTLLLHPNKRTNLHTLHH
jgi:hypothetical protein